MKEVVGIPNSIVNMESMFTNCTSLVNISVLPESITSMYRSFYGCTSLANVPAIPASVTNIIDTFYGCVNLTGTLRINSSNISNFDSWTFYGTTKPIRVEVPAGSATYTKISSYASSMPNNVTLATY